MANSPSGGDVANVAPDTITGSHNLIETPITGGGVDTLTGTIMADPMLGPLQNNGGPTQTMALLPGSPAINAGATPVARASPPPTSAACRSPVSPAARWTSAPTRSSRCTWWWTPPPTRTTATPSPAHFSLREAITLANAFPGADTISFAIPGAGVHTISLLSSLPAITDPVVIDGTTQPGFNPQTAIPVIEVNGS